ncbi:MAG: peptide deformylase [Candidatus Dormibacteria bacterium]
MAVIPILTHEQPSLRQRAKKVARVDASIQKLIDDMVDTMLAAPGVGLAANQVGVLHRVIVVKADDSLHVLVNPELVRAEGEQVGYEGCLSYPGYIGEVRRSQSVIVRGRNRTGKEIKVKGEGFVARALQHELDHLDGILFIDRLTDVATLRPIGEMADQDESELMLAEA